MPLRPKHPCNHPRCPNLTKDRFCETHRKQERQRADKQRGTSTQRGYGARWRKARKIHLNEHPLCVHCKQEGKIVPANEVDHAIAHKGDYFLFWDESNWQSLCKSCHSRKTAIENGGFGR